MNKFLLAVAVLLFVGFVAASELPPAFPEGDLFVRLTPTFRGAPFPSTSFTISVLEENRVKQLYSDSDGALKIDFYAGNYSLEITRDDPATPGNDYFARIALDVSHDEAFAVELSEVASASFVVKDGDGNALEGVDVEFDCLGRYRGQGVTDSHGLFSVLHLPVGACSFSFKKGGQAVQETLYLKRGDLQQREIKMNPETPLFSYLALIAFIAAVAAVAYFVRSKRAQAAKPLRGKAVKPLPKKLVVRESVLRALPQTEREVLRKIAAQGGRCKQSLLARELFLPKASLSKAVHSLERKGLIGLARKGKVNELELKEL